jgi:hypothetical protein
MIISLSFFDISANGCCRGGLKANEKCPVGIADIDVCTTQSKWAYTVPVNAIGLRLIYLCCVPPARSGDDGDASDAGDAAGCAPAPRASPRRHGAAKCQPTPPTPAAPQPPPTPLAAAWTPYSMQKSKCKPYSLNTMFGLCLIMLCI